MNRPVAVIGDSGTHPDPVTGEIVSNSGRFVMTSSGLEWRSPDVLSQKADASRVSALEVGDFTAEANFRFSELSPDSGYAWHSLIKTRVPRSWSNSMARSCCRSLIEILSSPGL